MILAAIDTNILVYAADGEGDRKKHEASVALLHRLAALGRGLLPLQSLSEFYAAAVRKRAVAPADAAAFMDLLAEMFPVREAVLADVTDAVRVHTHHGLQFWDGMLWSVARRAGARYLFSEDFQDGRELEGVRFINPFVPANAKLLETIVDGGGTD